MPNPFILKLGIPSNEDGPAVSYVEIHTDLHLVLSILRDRHAHELYAAIDPAEFERYRPDIVRSIEHNQLRRLGAVGSPPSEPRLTLPQALEERLASMEGAVSSHLDILTRHESSIEGVKVSLDRRLEVEQTIWKKFIDVETAISTTQEAIDELDDERTSQQLAEIRSNIRGLDTKYQQEQEHHVKAEALIRAQLTDYLNASNSRLQRLEKAQAELAAAIALHTGNTGPPKHPNSED